MKRILLAAAFGLFTLASVANPRSSSPKVTYLAKESFKQQFGYVKDITWTQPKNDLFRADFMVEGQTYSAFIRQDGELVATTITKEKSQLPIRLRIALEQELKGQTIDDLFFVDAPDESAYYFTSIQNGKKKVYRAHDNGKIKEVSKEILQ